jgi:hypothetical protein
MFPTKKFQLASFALGLAGACLTGSAAHAASMAIDVVGGTAFIRGTWANFGYSFDVSQPVRMEALGLLDIGADGLAEPHEVGLWDMNGNLLASTIINNQSTPHGSAGDHEWLFSAIAPVDLMPGTYKLGAFYRSQADAFLASKDPANTQLLLAPEVTYGEPLVTTGGIEAFSEPVTPAGFAPGFFGPNAIFTVLPEPTSLSALLLAALGMGRRRGK